MEEAGVVDWDLPENQLKFVNILKEFPIILEKSMLPEFKKKRVDAILKIRRNIAAEFKVDITEAQLWKKVQNMRARLKKKSDENRIGTKQIVLKPWEEQFLKFLEGDSNPLTVGMKRVMTTGTSLYVNDRSEKQDSSEDEIPEEIQVLQFEIPQVKKLKLGSSTISPIMAQNTNKNMKTLPETEETKNLSTSELQRLVLLEQLNYIRKSQQLVNLKLKKELQREERVDKSANENLMLFQ